MRCSPLSLPCGDYKNANKLERQNSREFSMLLWKHGPAAFVEVRGSFDFRFVYAALQTHVMAFKTLKYSSDRYEHSMFWSYMFLFQLFFVPFLRSTFFRACHYPLSLGSFWCVHHVPGKACGEHLPQTGTNPEWWHPSVWRESKLNKVSHISTGSVSANYQVFTPDMMFSSH